MAGRTEKGGDHTICVVHPKLDGIDGRAAYNIDSCKSKMWDEGY